VNEKALFRWGGGGCRAKNKQNNSILIIILIVYVKLLPNKLESQLHTKKKLPEDDQELRPQNVGAIINKIHFAKSWDCVFYCNCKL